MVLALPTAHSLSIVLTKTISPLPSTAPNGVCFVQISQPKFSNLLV
ncbi:hypothetical protein COLO4_32818 [Corchorus olitorius]|uniref:Uncharacterized protein n=1 Tax=Corchorus olitorius TaxID=93759 RepID=A0A1R3GXT8_9ROSI|nr:hypothetical protein COLO4_32818 [Corchorus olitorius]